MDITIQMRSLELMVKMLKRDMEGVPQYGYLPQLNSQVLPVEGRLPRCTPEEAGISSTAVEKLIHSLEEDRENLGIHSIMLLRRGQVFAEAHWAPFRGDMPHMLYSASKSVTGTAIGMACDEGLMDIDQRLEEIFPAYPSSHKWAREITLRHLLTMSTGVRFNEVGSALDEDWVRMYMESVPKFQPGTQFEYNSMNTYMLSAALREKTGMTMTEFLTPRLYRPLKITNYSWETCPRGTEKGGWGLSLCIEDMAKIAQLYLDGGIWEGRRLLSEEWIKEATSAQIGTPNGEMKNGYGYQIWIGKNGAYQFNGAFGQYAVIFPDHEAVAVIYSGSSQLFAKTSLLKLLDSCLWAAAEPLPPYPEGNRRLEEYESSLVFSPVISREGMGTDPEEFAAMAEKLEGREYRLSENHGSVFPQPLQNVHGCYTQGLEMVRFENADGGLAVTFYEHYERNTLYVNGDGTLRDSRYIIREEDHPVSTRGLWKIQDGEMYLTLITSFIRTPDTRVIHIRFREDSIELIFDETPSAEGATRMLLELVGIVDDASLKRLAPTLKRVPGLTENSINELVNRYCAPTAYGRAIRCHI